MLPFLQQPSRSLLCWNISQSLGSAAPGCKGWCLIPLFRVFGGTGGEAYGICSPRLPGGVGECPSSCWGDPCPSVLPQPRPKGVLRVQGVSLAPLCSQQGHGQGCPRAEALQEGLHPLLAFLQLDQLHSRAGSPSRAQVLLMVTVGLLGYGCLGCWEVCWIKDSHLSKAGLW